MEILKDYELLSMMESCCFIRNTKLFLLSPHRRSCADPAKEWNVLADTGDSRIAHFDAPNAEQGIALGIVRNKKLNVSTATLVVT